MPRQALQFGEIAGAPVGTTARTRQELRDGGLHRALQAGIDFGPEGAAAVVLSGVYPDDDQGSLIIYTGQGGLAPGTSRAIADQPLALGNAALIRNCRKGLPVRVIRRVGSRFRYDGLYSVDRYFRERFGDGFVRWRYELRQVEREAILTVRDDAGQPVRVERTVLRVIRDTALSRRVKELYAFQCQVCEVSLPTAVGPYAEAAHVRPLGRPHNGPDALSNLLCLCPNDHVLFDFGAITIWPHNLQVTGERSRDGRTILLKRGHQLDPMHLDYHNEAIYVPIVERLER